MRSVSFNFFEANPTIKYFKSIMKMNSDKTNTSLNFIIIKNIPNTQNKIWEEKNSANNNLCNSLYRLAVDTCRLFCLNQSFKFVLGIDLVKL